MKLKLLLFPFCLAINSAHAVHSDLSQKLSEIREKNDLPGIAGALSINGSLTQLEVSGLKKIGSQAKLERTDPFHLGSCTKAMTATLVATFVEEEKFSWDTKLTEILPEFNLDHAFKEMSIEELLAHRSGLIKDPKNDLYKKLQQLEPSEARKSVAKIFLEQKPSFDPLSFNYSNVGYIIVGYILEKVSGKTWEMLMVERLFSPLGMSSCGFGPTSDPAETIVTKPWGHTRENGRLTPLHLDNAAFYGPSATVHCSLSDWNKFLNLHLQGFNGEAHLLKLESFHKLHTPYPGNDESYTYGGWIRVKRAWADGPVLTHTGSNTINFANVWIAPRKGAVLMSTSNSGGEPAQLGTNDVIGALLNYLVTP